MALEIGELTGLIMISVAVVIFIISMILQKSLIKYFPGIICTWFIFLFTNIEALPEIATELADLFNLFEHTFIMLSAICFTLGILYEYYSGFIRSKLDHMARGEK
ncbi:MAG: hypothetical protein EU541_00150 [Promethearchaeota archaeon]|nr:MAG: hypothetical protein EU541_00150 [Candidatus Lokiarchaeota archaeon]